MAASNLAGCLGQGPLGSLNATRFFFAVLTSESSNLGSSLLGADHMPQECNPTKLVVQRIERPTQVSRKLFACLASCSVAQLNSTPRSDPIRLRLTLCNLFRKAWRAPHLTRDMFWVLRILVFHFSSQAEARLSNHTRGPRPNGGYPIFLKGPGGFPGVPWTHLRVFENLTPCSHMAVGQTYVPPKLSDGRPWTKTCALELLSRSHMALCLPEACAGGRGGRPGREHGGPGARPRAARAGAARREGLQCFVWGVVGERFCLGSSSFFLGGEGFVGKRYGLGSRETHFPQTACNRIFGARRVPAWFCSFWLPWARVCAEGEPTPILGPGGNRSWKPDVARV